MKNQILESVFAAMFFLIFLMFFEGMPKSTDTWVEYGIKSVAIAVIFPNNGRFFSKKSLKKTHQINKVFNCSIAEYTMEESPHVRYNVGFLPYKVIK